MLAWCFWAAIAMLGCGYGGLFTTMWVSRFEFKVKARSPALMFVSSLGGFAAMVLVLLQWRSRAQGSSLPCITMAYITPCVSVFMATPYCFRAVRLIVAHNPEYRYKFVRFIKWKPLTILWIMVVITVTTETALARHFLPRSHCFATDPFLVGTFTVFGAVPALYLARSIRNAYDAFGIRQELERVLLVESICGAIFVLLQVFVVLKLLPNSLAVHVFDEFVWLVVGAQVGIWSMLVPLTRHKKWYRRAKLFVASPEASSSPGSPTRVVGGVLDLAARSGDIGVRFEDFCKQHHALESWEFVLKAMEFKKISPGIVEQHRVFVEIVDRFITSTSPAQINIESVMRNHIVAFRTRDIFGHLNGEERRNVLDKPLSEAVRLLEFNLLEKFWQTELRRQDEELANIAKEDKNLMDIIVSGEESVRGGRRGSSVNASRHRPSNPLPSQAGSLHPVPAASRDDGSSIRTAEYESSADVGGAKPSRGTPSSTRSPSNSGSSVQTIAEKAAHPNEFSPSPRERPFFPFTRRSSQIRPLLSSIEASGRVALDDWSGARVALDSASSGTRVGSGDPQ